MINSFGLNEWHNNYNIEQIEEQENPSTSDISISLFNEENAFQNIVTQLNFGYRIPGTEPNRNCVQWINSTFSQYGNSEIINYTIHDVICQNVLGKINQGKGEIIIFATHFDSRAVSEKDSDPLKKGVPDPGANDGGSGVAVLLELARVLSNISLPVYEFWFLFLDAEDQGLNGVYGLSGWNWCEGSIWQANDMNTHPEKYFNSTQSISNISAFILLDMVGGTNLQFIAETHSDTALRKQIFSIGQSLGYSNVFPTNPRTASIIDDHIYFANLGIPTVDLIIDFYSSSKLWPYHHTTADNITNISKESLKIIGRTLVQFTSILFDVPLQREESGFSLGEIIILSILGICISIGLIYKLFIHYRKKRDNVNKTIL